MLSIEFDQKMKKPQKPNNRNNGVTFRFHQPPLKLRPASRWLPAACFLCSQILPQDYVLALLASVPLLPPTSPHIEHCLKCARYVHNKLVYNSKQLGQCMSTFSLKRNHLGVARNLFWGELGGRRLRAGKGDLGRMQRAPSSLARESAETLKLPNMVLNGTPTANAFLTHYM